MLCRDRDSSQIGYLARRLITHSRCPLFGRARCAISSSILLVRSDELSRGLRFYYLIFGLFESWKSVKEDFVSSNAAKLEADTENSDNTRTRMEVTEEPTSTEIEESAELDTEGDGGATVEESYEVTTTRRKTVRTSYKIQEVSVENFPFWVSRVTRS